MIISESGIRFEFSDDYTVLKYDDTDFHKLLYNTLSGTKAVDFLAANGNAFLFIEVKNCVGNEADNRWRIAVNNSKRDTIPTGHDVVDRDSFDIEIPQKVAMSIAALVGAYTRPTPHRYSDTCMPVAEKLCSEDIRTEDTHAAKRRIYIILVLEGSFGNGLKTNTERMVRDRIARSMKNKLKWLNCTVQVISAHELEKLAPGMKATLEA